MVDHGHAIKQYCLQVASVEVGLSGRQDAAEEAIATRTRLPLTRPSGPASCIGVDADRRQIDPSLKATRWGTLKYRIGARQ